MKNKECVKIRQRKIQNGNISLYLDIYRKGVRNFEFLKLYLVPETTRADKEKNKETMRLAEAIKAKRIVEIQNNEYGFRNDRKSTKFFEYFLRLCDEKNTAGNIGNWNSCYKHLLIYEKNRNITFDEIDTEWVKGFRDYLDNANYARTEATNNRKIALNSKYSYFNKLKACLKQAFEDRIISYNPAVSVKGYDQMESTRMYLTIQEVKRLAETKCKSEIVKRTFLFSCLTGLRRSDIERITWGNVHQQGEFTRIIFRQKKTHGQEYLDINQQASDLMGERRGSHELVFGKLPCFDYVNNTIRQWVATAGIDKDITFHCGRHTFATMMLDLDTDIYTVSKLLGHREISTTQIYAKIMDKNKQNAVGKIPSIFDSKENGNV